MTGARGAYDAPAMDVRRAGDDVRTDVIVDSDGIPWTDWYSLDNPGGPSGGALR